MSRGKLWLFVGLVGGFVGLLYMYNPAQTHIFPRCTFHELTGLYCPGCGSTRAVHQLLHGSVAGALSMNPLMVIMLPVLLLLCLQKNWASKSWVAWCAFVVLVSYGVLRNINLWPFILLAPK